MEFYLCSKYHCAYVLIFTTLKKNQFYSVKNWFNELPSEGQGHLKTNQIQEDIHYNSRRKTRLHKYAKLPFSLSLSLSLPPSIRNSYHFLRSYLSRTQHYRTHAWSQSFHRIWQQLFLWASFSINSNRGPMPFDHEVSFNCVFDLIYNCKPSRQQFHTAE